MKINLDEIKPLELEVTIGGEEKAFPVFDTAEAIRQAAIAAGYMTPESPNIPPAELARIIRKVADFEDAVSIDVCMAFADELMNATDNFRAAKND